MRDRALSMQSASDNEKIMLLIGAIVLLSQEAERHLKISIPFMDADDPSLGATLKRHSKLRRRSLGDLAEKLVNSATSSSPNFKKYFDDLIDTRNQIVHHFYEMYAAELGAGAHGEVIKSLQAFLARMQAFVASLEQCTLVVFEGLRDVTFHGTPEYDQFAELCASFRQRCTALG